MSFQTVSDKRYFDHDVRVETRGCIGGRGQFYTDIYMGWREMLCSVTWREGDVMQCYME